MATNSLTHNRSQSLSLLLHIYRFDIYRDSYPRLCVALRNKHRQKLIMRPWSIIIRPLSSAASSPHITVHNPDNKIPIVPVSSACKSISANRESFDPDTRLRQPSLLFCFRMVRSGTTILLLFSLFLYFFLFSIFFFFSNTHTSRCWRKKRDWRRRKEDWNGWKVAETRVSFDFSILSFSRAISLANRWSNPSLDSI